MKKFKIFYFILLILLLGSCHSGNKNASSINDKNIAHFKGRAIDLKAHLEGFPYSSFEFSYGSNMLYYMKSGEIIELLELKLTGNPDLTKGRKISDIDFSKRNTYGFKYNENDHHLYWQGDEINDEVFNLYRLNPATKEVEKLTDVPYIYGYSFNKDKSKIAYVARLAAKDKEGVSELRILNLETLEDTKIIEDTEEMRYTWGDPGWQPDGKGIVICANKNALRTHLNLVHIDYEKKTQTTLLDPNIYRGMGGMLTPAVFKEWMNETTFFYITNENGFANVYSYNLVSKQSTQITNFEIDLGTAEIITIDGSKYLFATTSSPIETQMYLIDPASGKNISQQSSDLFMDVLDTKGDKVVTSSFSNAIKFQIDEIKFQIDQFDVQTLVEVPKDLQEKIYSAIPEQVSYPTFDIDPATGKTRELHAYLYKPKNPLPKKNQIVMIQSFYGGLNMFSEETEILADAGIYVFSPSPRGSFSLGREFLALNDGDLGGNEIIDVIYAAQYISEKLGIPPQNIGLFGTSHGGYATMRALTFPGEVNGNKADFDWGFGVATAGFSDIIHFYENCNIPDWVILEAGDPKTEAAKLKDRSPLYHADKLKGSLLLIHGTNDMRVPIAGSQMMADSLRKYNKPYKFVEFEGQGHGVKGVENNIIYYQTIFDFLEEVTRK